RVSPNGNDRPKLTLSATMPGPGIVFRPASPNAPAGGAMNARGLKNPALEERSSQVASARRLPIPPVWASSAAGPKTRAVSGVPVCAVTEPLKVQSLSSRVWKFAGAEPEPAAPTGDVRTQFRLKEWRRSKLERPRSAL